MSDGDITEISKREKRIYTTISRCRISIIVVNLSMKNQIKLLKQRIRLA